MYVLYRALVFILQHTVAVMLSIDFVIIYTCIEMLKVQPPSHLREMDWTHAHKGQVAVQNNPWEQVKPKSWVKGVSKSDYRQQEYYAPLPSSQIVRYYNSQNFAAKLPAYNIYSAN